jgi:hypothetical protein
MKKIQITALLAFFGFSFFSSYGQENRFFMPLEIEKAYEKGTRSYDGQPGPSYWQNAVDYKIKVTIVPSEKLIDGYEEVIYQNDSPDEINRLVVRLYADAYKKGNSRASSIHAKDIYDGVELADVTINGVSYDLDDQRMTQRGGTNIYFTLQESLKPGSNLTFKASWKQKVPSFSRIRTGAYDSTTFFIAYWYPQISVYDDIFGWDNLDYTLMTEFYNNLGNYDVEITAPNEYIVWATGTLENSAEVLPEDIYGKYQKARSSEEVIHIVSVNDIDNGIKTLNNTWHYTASEVSDFAFAMSNHYLWDAAMQPVANRQVFISSAHPIDTTMDFSDHIAYQQKAMQHFSEDIPGIPYPYEAFTTFIYKGGGGMEYPMMANNGGPGRGVTVHEMFHTYFPMYVRTNERRWAWMDEGWATYNTAIVENRFFEDDYEIGKVFSSVNPSRINGAMGTIADLPLIISSQFLTGQNYGYASYPLPAMIYAIIHQHLGEELFLKCYQEYIKRWAKKSPTPYDFFYTFEDVSGQDLSWIWKPWFFDFGVSDVAIKSFEKNTLTLINKGNKPVPIFVDIDYKNGESKFIGQSASTWADGKNEHQIAIPDYDNVEKLTVNKMVADVNVLDNFFPSILSRYKDIDISDELMGQYRVEELSVNVIIKKEDRLMYFKIPDFGASLIIYPEDSVNFSSLDDSLHIKFNMNDSGQCTSMDFDSFGSSFNGKKLE